MSRYTGPKARVSRRLGTNIWGTKGENVAMEKRPYPPGEHGRSRRRGNVSEYLLQLQEKQKARFTYGMTEKQFRNLYEEANRRQGVTGENLLRYCEQRLDTVVYRAGDQVGAWSYAGARALGLATIGIAVAAIPVSLVWGGIALWLGRRQRQLESDGSTKNEDEPERPPL